MQCRPSTRATWPSTDVMAGRGDLMFDRVTTGSEMGTAGNLPLVWQGVTAREDLDVVGWSALFAPRTTPPAFLKVLTNAVCDLGRDSAFGSAMLRRDTVPVPADRVSDQIPGCCEPTRHGGGRWSRPSTSVLIDAGLRPRSAGARRTGDGAEPARGASAAAPHGQDSSPGSPQAAPMVRSIADVEASTRMLRLVRGTVGARSSQPEEEAAQHRQFRIASGRPPRSGPNVRPPASVARKGPDGAGRAPRSHTRIRETSALNRP